MRINRIIYILLAFIVFSCEKNDYQEESDILIPEIFSPNHDGYNDEFMPIGIAVDLIESYEITIFDIVGNIVFTSNNPEEAWYGSDDRGTYYPNGQYICLIECKYTFGKKQKIQGAFLLIDSRYYK